MGGHLGWNYCCSIVPLLICVLLWLLIQGNKKDEIIQCVGFLPWATLLASLKFNILSKYIKMSIWYEPSSIKDFTPQTQTMW